MPPCRDGPIGVGQTVLYDFYADCAALPNDDPLVKQLHAQGYPISRSTSIATMPWPTVTRTEHSLFRNDRQWPRGGSEIGGTSANGGTDVPAGGAGRSATASPMLAGGGGAGVFPPINVASGATCPVQHFPARTRARRDSGTTLPNWQPGLNAAAEAVR